MLFALGDVLDLGDEIERVAIPVMDEGNAQHDGHMAAVLVEITFLHLVGQDFAGQQLLDKVQVLGQVVGMGDVLEIGRQQFSLGMADHVAQGVVDLEPAALRADQ